VLEIWDSFDCDSVPGGDYIKVPLPELLSKCNRTGFPCPHGLDCFCHPCIINPEVNYFNWQLVLAMCITIYVVGVSMSLVFRPDSEVFPRSKRH